ncbi:hypothetical protein D3C71_2106910 [compost metagenome]
MLIIPEYGNKAVRHREIKIFGIPHVGQKPAQGASHGDGVPRAIAIQMQAAGQGEGELRAFELILPDSDFIHKGDDF